ncbi:MAG TPA: ABC transporter permease [Terriglobales bacterium]|jgi:predicted permease|nr:ABC transporter permease [Terriglobales bacterium]
MRWYYKLPLRLRSLFRREQAERELNEEIQFHLQSLIDQYVAQGMKPETARYTALRELGHLEPVKEQCREMRNVNFIENVLQDVHFGLRMLRRNPGFSTLAVLCLILGIGSNAAVFSWIEGILLHPYPAVAHQDRLLMLAATRRGEIGYNGFSWPDFLDLQRSCTLCDAVIAEKIVGVTLSIGDRAESGAGSLVSSNYFDALGIRPILGRGFEPDEDFGRNAHPVTVISYQLWQNRFHGDPGIVGKTQVLNGLPHTIVGVAPKGFYGTFIGYSWKLWVPISMQERFEPGGYKTENRGERWIEGFLRMKPGVTSEQVQAEVSGFAERLENNYPATNRGLGINVLPLWKAPFNGASFMLPTLGIGLGIGVFVLLIVCANVSNLLLVRFFARRHEISARLALGATRGRVLRQLFTEGLILSIIGAAGGIVLAYWCRNLLVVLIPPRSGPIFLPGQMDWRVLVLSAGVCLISTVLFALVPVLESSKVDLASALKSESGSVIGARGRARIRAGLVVVQVSLSFVLLVGACLVVLSLEKIRTGSPGFSTDGVLSTAVNLMAAGYDTPRAKNFQDALIDRVQTIPGIESAAYGRVAPLGYRDYTEAPIAVEGYEPALNEQPMLSFNEVGPSYFSTMGIPLISGREFTRADNETSPPVAIVNEAMVTQYWYGENPVGKRFQVNGRWVQVVGVAKLSKYRSIMEAPKAFFYVPLRQNFAPTTGLVLRTQQPADAIARALAREVHALDPDLAPYAVITMREQIERSTSGQHAAVMLLTIFGSLAVLLATIGLYGVLSYAVSQSTRELGLRMALGARGSDLLRIVISQGLSLTATGVIVGATIALAGTRLLGYLLYKVSPRDPLAFGSAFAVMIVAALAACFVPALRATRTDPVRALRQ